MIAPILALLFSACISCMTITAEEQPLHVYGLPAADDTGCKEAYIRSLYGDHITFTPVPTPIYPMDFGQTTCLERLDTALKVACTRGVIHAACGGTATVINYLASGEKEDLIEAAVLEGPIASINMAAEHRASKTLTEPIFKNKVIDRWVYHLSSTNIGKYFFPHLLIFCGYIAWKKQPLEIVATIKHKDIRIVIVMQHPNDHVASATQAQALYYAFRKHGYDNVFIMPHQNKTHVNVLCPQNEDTKAMKRIVQGDIRAEDREKYQPDYEQFEPLYATIMKRDKEVRLGL